MKLCRREKKVLEGIGSGYKSRWKCFYVFGLSKNQRLLRILGKEMHHLASLVDHAHPAPP